MIDARSYSAEETLKNGTVVRIRAIRADDKHEITEGFGRLQAKSIYTRFFEYKKALTDEELKTYIEVDFENVVAMVVTTREKETEAIIGGGRYLVFGIRETQRIAELAFMVGEDYQGLGIASITLRHLAGIAKDKGITQFYAEVLPENGGMLAVFERSGFPMKKEYAEGVVHITLSLRGE